MSPEIAVLAGALVGSLGTLGVTYMNNRAEERKHQRALIYQAGIENFKEACAMGRHTNRGSISPMEDFILHIAVIASRLSTDGKLSKEQVLSILEDGSLVTSAINEFRDKSKNGR